MRVCVCVVVSVGVGVIVCVFVEESTVMMSIASQTFVFIS